MAKKPSTPNQPKRKLSKPAVAIAIIVAVLLGLYGYGSLFLGEDGSSKSSDQYTQPDEKDYSQEGGHSKTANEPTFDANKVIDPSTVFDPDNLSEIFEATFDKGESLDTATYIDQNEQVWRFNSDSGKTLTVHSSSNKMSGNKTVYDDLLAKAEQKDTTTETIDPESEDMSVDEAAWIGDDTIVLQQRNTVMWITFKGIDRDTAKDAYVTAASVMHNLYL